MQFDPMTPIWLQVMTAREKAAWGKTAGRTAFGA